MIDYIAQIHQLKLALDLAIKEGFRHKFLSIPEHEKHYLLERLREQFISDAKQQYKPHIHIDPEVLAEDLLTGEVTPVSSGGKAGEFPADYHRLTESHQPEQK